MEFTVAPLNNGHLRAVYFVLCKEVVLLREVEYVLELQGENI